MRRLFASLLLFVSACGGPPAAAPSPAEVDPFPAFVDSLRSAKYGDYAPPASKVDSEAAFEGMRRYLLDKYGSVQVPHTYMENGITFDCLPSTASASGNRCPPGYIPQRRLTLADLTRFPTLQAYLARNPGGGKVPPTPPPT